MASSLIEECTPLKRAYDSCFNAWFESYLQPNLGLQPTSSSSSTSQSSDASSSSSTSSSSTSLNSITTKISAAVGLPVTENKTPLDREAYAKQKAEEYEKRCGDVWRAYRTCVQKAVKEKGIEDLLSSAREEHPLVDPPPPPVDDIHSAQSASKGS